MVTCSPSTHLLDDSSFQIILVLGAYLDVFYSLQRFYLSRSLQHILLCFRPFFCECGHASLLRSWPMLPQRTICPALSFLAVGTSFDCNNWSLPLNMQGWNTKQRKSSKMPIYHFPELSSRLPALCARLLCFTPGMKRKSSFLPLLFRWLRGRGISARSVICQHAR